MSALSVLPLPWKLGIAAIVAAAIIVVYLAWENRIETRGYNKAIAEVAADNREANERVRNAKAKLSDCRARGGTWNTVSGLCE